MEVLNYCNELNRPDLGSVFRKIHEGEWEKELTLRDNFILKNIRLTLQFLQIRISLMLYFMMHLLLMPNLNTGVKTYLTSYTN